MARILAFDDSKLFRSILSSVLQEMPYEFEAVCPGSLYEALKFLYEKSPALLITDYQMPNLNGESLVRAIREDTNLAKLKVLVLSAHHDADLITRIMQKGVDGYVLKDSSLKTELPRRVSEILSP